MHKSKYLHGIEMTLSPQKYSYRKENYGKSTHFVHLVLSPSLDKWLLWESASLLARSLSRLC